MFYQGVVSENGVRLSVPQVSYLDGAPQIDVTFSARMMTDWVIEDMRRQALPEPQLPVTLPGSSIAIASRLSTEDKQALKNRFARITKFDNWEINEKNGLVVWSKGFTNEEAIRIEKTLQLTKAVRVTRGTTRVKGVSVPMIKCEAINYQLITQLASSLQAQEPVFDFESILQNLLSK